MGIILTPDCGPGECTGDYRARGPIISAPNMTERVRKNTTARIVMHHMLLQHCTIQSQFKHWIPPNDRLRVLSSDD